ncbi:hypothetical protein TSUD_323250 [Trifolium subterraneum]|uniref:Uncharacterized protein n=1 Tax=Trifolium subterraneum TaxID=3900 RepID=A0A2Z6NS10_TRISU|nr:hypothetical protein TSUD_323250 [Trifolium subterraneum]
MLWSACLGSDNGRQLIDQVKSIALSAEGKSYETKQYIKGLKAADAILKKKSTSTIDADDDQLIHPIGDEELYYSH